MEYCDMTPCELKVMVEITTSDLYDLLKAEDDLHGEGIGPDLRPLIKKILKAFWEE